jgi:hypothetical protein
LIVDELLEQWILVHPLSIDISSAGRKGCDGRQLPTSSKKGLRAARGRHWNLMPDGEVDGSVQSVNGMRKDHRTG